MVAALVAKYEEKERHIVQLFFILTISLAGLYGYFLFSSIIDALLRKDFEKTAVQIESSVASVEREYMQKSALLDRDHALALGFVVAPAPHFIAKGKSSTEGLSFNR